MTWKQIGILRLIFLPLAVLSLAIGLLGIASYSTRVEKKLQQPLSLRQFHNLSAQLMADEFYGVTRISTAYVEHPLSFSPLTDETRKRFFSSKKENLWAVFVATDKQVSVVYFTSELRKGFSPLYKEAIKPVLHWGPPPGDDLEMLGSFDFPAFNWHLSSQDMLDGPDGVQVGVMWSLLEATANSKAAMFAKPAPVQLFTKNLRFTMQAEKAALVNRLRWWITPMLLIHLGSLAILFWAYRDFVNELMLLPETVEFMIALDNPPHPPNPLLFAFWPGTIAKLAHRYQKRLNELQKSSFVPSRRIRRPKKQSVTTSAPTNLNEPLATEQKERKLEQLQYTYDLEVFGITPDKVATALANQAKSVWVKDYKEARRLLTAAIERQRSVNEGKALHQPVAADED